MSRHSSGLTGGIAVGAFLWGEATASWGVGASVAASGIALLATALVGLFLPMPRVSLSELERVEVGREPEVALQLTSRSGPIVIEIDYTVDEIGRAHVRTPVTNAHLVCRLLLEKKKNIHFTQSTNTSTTHQNMTTDD